MSSFFKNRASMSLAVATGLAKLMMMMKTTTVMIPMVALATFSKAS
jgi:hypothetical protein